MELGSEFSLGTAGTPCGDSVFHVLSKFDAVYVDSGRSALRLLLEELRPGTILVPAYICEAVYRCFPKERVRFYNVTSNLEIHWDSLFQQLSNHVSAVYLHYFNGLLPDAAMLRQLRDIREALGFQIIEDTTHSIFSSALTVGDYGVCSLRKWFPIADGGVLYGRKLKRVDINSEAPWVAKKARAMDAKRIYLLSEQEGHGAECHKAEYRRLFGLCEHLLDRQRRCYGMSRRSREILESCSVQALISTRKRNAAQVQSALAEGFSWLQPLAWPRGDSCPMLLPVMVQNRDELRAYLTSKKIYCAIHWPLRGTSMESTSVASVSERELSLPIDQRYGAAEMNYLLECLRQYGRIHAETD